MANHKQFSEIVTDVAKVIKDTPETFQDIIKIAINQVYLTEILMADTLYPLHWLMSYLRLPVRGSATITNITQASPAVVTVDTANAFLANDIIAIFGVEGMEEINCDYEGYADDISQYGLYLIEELPTPTTLKLNTLAGSNADASGYTAYTSGGTCYHHGCKLPVQPYEILDVGLHDGLPLVGITWKRFVEDPDHYLNNGGGTPDSWIYQPALTTAGAVNDKLFWFPGAHDDDTLYLNATWEVDRLAADTDVPILPARFHDALVSGAVTRLMESNVAVEAPAMWPQLYQAHLDAIVSYNRNWWRKQEEADRKERLF